MFTLRSVLAFLAAGSALVLTANADVCECINLKNGISHPKMTKKCCAQVSGNWDSGVSTLVTISPFLQRRRLCQPVV